MCSVGEPSWSRCSRSARACPPRWPASRYVFRSFSTYMSIETRAGPFSRSIRTLIKKRADMAKSIKDLKDLRVLRRRAGYRHSGPTALKRTRDVFFVLHSVVCDRLITNSSGSGDPELQGLAHERWRGTGLAPTMKGGLFAAAAPGGAPPYCIETGRSLLPGKRNRFMKHPQNKQAFSFSIQRGCCSPLSNIRST